jgi:hypothetical protein
MVLCTVPEKLVELKDISIFELLPGWIMREETFAAVQPHEGVTLLMERG